MVHLDGFIAFITADTLKVIWSGLKVTLLITAAGLLLGTLLAALLCAASRSKIIVLRVAEKVFSVVVRGTPVLMLLLLLFSWSLHKPVCLPLWLRSSGSDLTRQPT